MELIYLWINGYKNLNNLSLIFDKKYEDYSKYDEERKIFYLDLRQENNSLGLFKEHNLNITTIIGENGSGKSNILDVIFDITKNNQSKIDYDYCLVITINEKLYYCKSNKVSIETDEIEEISEELKQEFLWNTLIFRPFSKKIKNDIDDKPLGYDFKHKFQNKINNGFYYDRFDEKETTQVLATIYKKLNKTLLINENRQLEFNSFRWEFSISDCLSYMSDRLKRTAGELNDRAGYILFSNIENNVKKTFFEILKRIESFEIEKKTLNEDYIYKELFPKAYFYSAIFELATFIYHIDGLMKKEVFKKYPEDNKDYKILDKSYNESYSISNDIIQELVLKFEFKENIHTIEFINAIIEVINDRIIKDRMLSYDIDLKVLDIVMDNLQKYIYLLGDKKDYFDSLFQKHFEYITNKSLFILRDDDSLKMDKLKDISFTTYSEYNELNDLLPSTFINQFFLINLYNKKNTNYTFNDLSSGEQRILRFFSDLCYCGTNLKEKHIYLFDEMDLSWHPEWQRKMIYYIMSVMKSYRQNAYINILIATHSPFILSDMPKENVILITKKELYGNAEVSKKELVTFGANIHSLFADSFFLKSTVGEFAKNKIKEIMNLLKDPTTPSLDIKTTEKMKKTIQEIGEPVIKNQLLRLFSMFQDEDLKRYKSLSKENRDLRKKNKELMDKLNDQDGE